MSRRVVALVAAGALLFAGCGDDGPAAGTDSAVVSPTEGRDDATATVTTTSTTSTTPAPTTSRPAGPPYAVESEQRRLVDDRRPTPATAELAEQPSRTVDVWIDRPVTSGARPLVVFAHGLTGHPRSHELLRTGLAADGFVVVAPAFPLTNNDVPGAGLNAGDVANQVGDVSFLIDEVLADPDLAPFVDRDRIGMVGHSLGGLTTANAVAGPLLDDRIGAAVIMSAGLGVAPEVPVLFVHGDGDELIDLSIGRLGYDVMAAAGAPRLFLTLLGGDHITGILDDETDLGVANRGVVSAFLGSVLGSAGPMGENDPIAAIERLPLDVVALEAGGPEGPLVDWREFFRPG